MPVKFVGNFECSSCMATTRTITFQRPKRIEDLLPLGWTFSGDDTLCFGCSRSQARGEKAAAL